MLYHSMRPPALSRSAATYEDDLPAPSYSGGGGGGGWNRPNDPFLRQSYPSSHSRPSGMVTPRFTPAAFDEQPAPAPRHTHPGHRMQMTYQPSFRQVSESLSPEDDEDMSKEGHEGEAYVFPSSSLRSGQSSPRRMADHERRQALHRKSPQRISRVGEESPRLTV
jgi:hypothetical protein